MKIKFLKGAKYYSNGNITAFNTGDSADISDNDAKDLIGNGYATEVIDYQDKMMRPTVKKYRRKRK